MSAADVIAAYEAAYLRANGCACQIVKTERGGWYAVCKPGTAAFLIPDSVTRFRLGELPELTANLNARHPARMS